MINVLYSSYHLADAQGQVNGRIRQASDYRACGSFSKID
jgi:hypothetical protein